MPRQFDQFLHNAQLTNNPNNTISAGALANLIQPPPNLAQLLEQILIDAINKLLQEIDDVTGLDLLAFAEALEGLFGPGGLLTKLLAFIQSITGDGLIQALIDAIANALGHLGLGHLVSDIEKFLQSIPFFNIGSLLGSLNLGADIHAILNNIHEALNPSTTLAVVQTASGTSLPFGFGGAVTAGNCVVLVAVGTETGSYTASNPMIDAPTLNSVSVSGAYPIWNPYSNCVNSTAGSNDVFLSGWVLPNCPAANGLNFTTFVPAKVGFIAYEVSGLGNTPVVNAASNAAANTGTAVSSGATGNTTTKPTFVLGAGGVFTSSSAGGSGFTNTDPSTTAWAGYQIATAAGSNYTWSQTGSSTGSWAAGVACIAPGRLPTLLLSWLAAIPFANILSVFGLAHIGADVQAIVDKLANAWGQSGTGHTLANLLSYAEAIPHTVITEILGGSDLGADVQAIVDQLSNAFGHSGTGHTLANLLAYAESIPHTVITNILGSSDLGADVQAIVDKLSNAFGQTGTGHTLANLLAYAEAIPNVNIAAILGGANLGADVQAIVDKIANGLGNTGTGHTLANLLTYMGGLAPVLGSSTLGADVQAIVDKISNALGQTGTGHTLANLLSYLESIPNANLTAILGGANLGADVQAIVDKLVNGLGTTGTGHSLSTLLSLIEAIPNVNITAILGSANLGADVQAIVDKLSNAFGHTGTGHTLANLLAYAESIPGTVISGITAIEQNIVDDINDAVNGGSSTGNAVSTVLSNIESHNVALPVVFDAVGAGNTATTLGSGTALTWAHTIGTYGNEILLVAATFAVSGGFGSHTRTAKWTQTGGSADTMTSLGAINSGGSTGSTAGWVELFYLLNPSTNLSNSGSVSIQVNTALGNVIGQSVSYGNVAGVTGVTSGSSASNATSFAGVNATTPDTSYAVAAICASQSITSVVSGSLGTLTQRATTNFSTTALASNLTFADIPGVPLGLGSLGFTSFTSHSGTSASWGGVQAVLSPAHTHQTAYQTVVDAVVSNLTPGGGSIAGSDADLIGDVLSAIPALNVAGVGGPVTIADTHQATWDAAVQAIMGVTTTGHSIADFFNALLHLKTTANAAYSSSGAQNNVQIFNASGTYTVPAGMGNGNHFDIIVVGGGGGGAGGQYPDFGNGGAAGSWNAVTLTYGTSFTTGTTSFTVTVGAGGTAGAASGGTGGSGGSTSVAIAGYGSSPVTTSGGAGGSGVAFTGTGYQGASPGPETFNSVTYSGGAVQNTKSAAGNSPGGGGGGGYSVLGQAGGAGAPGAVIIVART